MRKILSWHTWATNLIYISSWITCTLWKFSCTLPVFSLLPSFLYPVQVKTTLSLLDITSLQQKLPKIKWQWPMYTPKKFFHYLMKITIARLQVWWNISRSQPLAAAFSGTRLFYCDVTEKQKTKLERKNSEVFVNEIGVEIRKTKWINHIVSISVQRRKQGSFFCRWQWCVVCYTRHSPSAFSRSTYEDGITAHFWISILLTICFWIPGVIYALIIVLSWLRIECRANWANSIWYTLRSKRKYQHYKNIKHGDAYHFVHEFFCLPAVSIIRLEQLHTKFVGKSC